MGACASKVKKNKEKYLKDDVSTANKKLNSVHEQSSSINADKFANVPFIDSEEKLPTTPPVPISSSSLIPTDNDGDGDEQTTIKNDFETTTSYSNNETIAKLKEEVATFLREKVLSEPAEKQKLVDYVHKRIIGTADEKKVINEHLQQCFSDIEQHKPVDSEHNIKRRLMNTVTIYVASQASDNSFLKALYDKMGSALDLNSLNAETSEHEVVNVTVTKRVRQVFLDQPSADGHPTSHNTVIHISNNEHSIPDDLPEDIRRKAEEVLNSFNQVIHPSK